MNITSRAAVFAAAFVLLFSVAFIPIARAGSIHPLDQQVLMATDEVLQPLAAADPREAAPHIAELLGGRSLVLALELIVQDGSEAPTISGDAAVLAESVNNLDETAPVVCYSGIDSVALHAGV